VESCRALKAGEFEIYYQPFFVLRNGAVAAFLALLRWNHPARGLIPPDEFGRSPRRSG
jgi:EAL domain-containing protein (putative c-di-GMP-specific phosphodiesterase class I)